MYICRRIPYFLFPVLILGAVLFVSVYLISASFSAAVSYTVSPETGSADIPVLMYHSLADSYSRAGEYVFPPDDFRRDMEYLSEHGFETVSASDVYDYAVNGSPLPEKPVMITFDDGFLNVLTYALPVFEELDMCGVANPVGAYSLRAEETGEHQPLYSYMTFEEIKQLAESGRFEIGSHTFDMHALDSRRGCGRKYYESDEEYRAALISDSRKMNALLSERCGIVTHIFAYPYGYISSESEDILSECGYSVLFTCYEKHNKISPCSKAEGEVLFLDRYNRFYGASPEEFMSEAGIV